MIRSLLFALLVVLICRPVAAVEDRPNILFIFSDDHAFQAISAYGSNRNRTPHIDRLAREGMRFDRCLVTNSICGPCRAVILTGKYSHLNGFRRNGNQFDGSQQTFPKLLRKNGYQTAMIGKWHLRTEPTGFDYWKVLPGQGAYYNPDFKTPKGTERIQGYCTDVITDTGLEWLKAKRDPDKPFMLMLQHKAPHREWAPGPAHLKTFDDVKMAEPATLFDDYSDRAQVLTDQEMTIARHMRPVFDLKIWTTAQKDSQPVNRFFRRYTPEQRKAFFEAYLPKNEAFKKAELKGQEKARWEYQRYVKDYLRCIQSVDDNVGRVLKYLDESGLSKNTIVIYSSDQGFYLGEHGWYDKRWIFEESLKTPLLVRWPGKVKPGSQNSNIVSNLDFAQTFLEMAGVEAPTDMQGQSLVPLMQGKTPDDWRKSFYYHYYEIGVHNVPAHFGVVTDRYKLVRYYQTRGPQRKPVSINSWELLDLKVNPLETKSFFADDSYTSIRGKLISELRRLQKKYQVSDMETDFPAQEK